MVWRLQDNRLNILLRCYFWRICLVLGPWDDLVSVSIEEVLQFNFGGQGSLVKFIKVCQCRHSPKNLFLRMQTLERIETTNHCVVSFFKNSIFIKQLHCCRIVLTLRVVLETLAFLDLDENIERCQLLLHMSDSVGKKFINADDVMMAAPDSVMTSR